MIYSIGNFFCVKQVPPYERPALSKGYIHLESKNLIVDYISLVLV